MGGAAGCWAVVDRSGELWRELQAARSRADMLAVDRIHRCFGHLGHTRMLQLPDVVSGLPVTRSQIQLWAATRGRCDACGLGKSARRRLSRQDQPRGATAPLQLVHTDVCGPLPAAACGSKYIVTVVDEYSKYSVLRFTRDRETVPYVLQSVLVLMETQCAPLRVKEIRSDRGGEYVGSVLADFCAAKGILQNFSAPYTPQLNGVAERLNQSLQRAGRAMLVDSKLDVKYWRLAAEAANAVRLRSPVRGLAATPHQLFTGVKPDASHMHVFGSKVYVHTPEPQRDHKFSPTGRAGRFIGWEPDGNYRVLVDSKLVVSRDVVFDEDRAANAGEPATATAAASAPPLDLRVDSSDSDNDSPPAEAAGVSGGPPAGQSNEQGRRNTSQQGAREQREAAPSAQELHVERQPGSGEAAAEASTSAVASEPHARRRRRRKPLKPPAQGGAAAGEATAAGGAPNLAAATPPDKAERGGGVPATALPPQPRRSDRSRAAPVRLGFSAIVVVRGALVQVLAAAVKGPVGQDLPGGDEPTFEQAKQRPDWPLWQAAIQEELDSLRSLEVFQPAHPPAGAKALAVRWVLKVKRDANGKAARWKARLVVKGYQQRPGRDFGETFAPTGRLASLRFLLAIVAARNLELHQIDVKTAFLHGRVEEEIYADLPPGCDLGDSELKLLLRKSLYGLRQAPRAWYGKLKETLERMGFVESDADPGLFVLWAEQGILFVLVHVDDMLMAAELLPLMDSTKKALNGHFAITDLGEASFYLGMRIDRDRANRTIKLSQERYTLDLLEAHGMSESKPVDTPMTVGTPLMRADKGGGELLGLGEAQRYRGIVGSLLYLANCTRPEISLAVGTLARFMAEPTEEHLKAAKRVLRYLKGTPGTGLVYGGHGLVLAGYAEPPSDAELSAESAVELKLAGYADADYAGCPNTRRSTTGYVFTLNGAAISWQSKLQPTVACSTVEAEYMAAGSATREALWLRKLGGDFGVLGSGPTVLLGDNQGAISLTRNPLHSAQTKHIDVMYHFVRERVAMGDLAVEYVPTSEMVADVLTKPLDAVKFKKFRGELGLK